MAWTTPTSQTTGTLISTTHWNTYVVDNLVYLKSAINAQIQIAGASMIPATTNGAAPGSMESTTNLNNYTTMDFADTGGSTYAHFNIILPSDYDGGNMTAKFYWYSTSTSTNSVVWAINAASIADDDALDASYSGSGTSVTDANKATAWDLNTATTSAFTIAGTPAAGEYCNFRVRRVSGDASDTLAATAKLLHLVLTYTRA